MCGRVVCGDVFKKIVGTKLKNFIFVFQNGDWQGGVISDEWSSAGKKIFNQIKSNPKFVPKFERNLCKQCQKLEACAGEISRSRLKTLSNRELAQ